MSDKIELLKDGIPIEVALVMLAVVVLPVIGLVMARRRPGDQGEKVLRITGILLCGAGLLVAGYVFYTAVILNEIPQCIAGGGGCGVVEKSRYSHILGIHVSTFGLIGYLILLGCFIWRGDRARVAAFAFALFGFGFSLYLTYLELWEILAICQWCVTSAVLMTMLFVVSSFRLWGHYGLDEPNS